MPDYPDPDKVEGPDEIDPQNLAVNKRAQVLLRNPESYVVEKDGTKTYSVDAKWLDWSDVPLIAEPSACGHSFSICYECADSWGTDHFIRFFDGQDMYWISPDHPDAPNNS